MLTGSVRDSVVGDALLRGVSGGEKKRVTIAEMLASRSPLLFLDEYTKVRSAFRVTAVDGGGSWA